MGMKGKNRCTPRSVRRFVLDTDAVTAIEYGVIGVCIALLLSVIVASDGVFLTALRDLFEALASEISSVASG